MAQRPFIPELIREVGVVVERKAPVVVGEWIRHLGRGVIVRPPDAPVPTPVPAPDIWIYVAILVGVIALGIYLTTR
jgi:hypothetical protein